MSLIFTANLVLKGSAVLEYIFKNNLLTKLIYQIPNYNTELKYDSLFIFLNLLD